MTETQGASPEQGSSPRKPFDLFAVLWERKVTVVKLALLCAVLLSPVAFLLSKNFYEASAVLRLSPTQQVFLSRTEDGVGPHFRQYARTQVSRIKQVPVIADALKRLPEGLRRQFVPGSATILDAAEAIQQELDVRQIEETHLIGMTLRGQNKEALTELLNQVMTVYLEKLDEEAKGKDNRRLAYLEQERRQLAAEIDEHASQLRLVAASGGASQMDAEANMYQFRWDALNKALVDAQNVATHARNAYEGALKRADAIRAVPLSPVVEEGVDVDPVVTLARSYTMTRIQEMQTRLEAMAPQNPERKVIDMRTEGLKEYLRDVEATAAADTEDLVTGKREIELRTAIIEAEYAYKTAQGIVRDLEQQIAELDAAMAERFQAFDSARGLSEEIESKQGLLRVMEDRIYRLRVESQAPGQVTVEGRARSKNKTNYLRIAVLWFLSSFALAAGFVALRSRMDPRISDRDHVVSALGAPPSWPIANYEVSGRPDLPFARMSVDDPNSDSAVAIRSLAIKLAKEHESSGARLCCFLGVGNHVGCTSIAINAAHGLSQICERVLLIDLNRRRPRLSNLLLADAREWSVLSVINGEGPVEQAVYRDSERGIDCLFMPPETGSAQISRRGVVQLLKELRHNYDMVVIDAAPLLESDLTELIVVHSDIICPVTRGHHSRYNDLVLTGKILERLEVKVIAPVLNWYKETPITVESNRQQEADGDLYSDGELPTTVGSK